MEVCVRFALMVHLLQSKSIRFRESSSELVILKNKTKETKKKKKKKQRKTEKEKYSECIYFFEMKAGFFTFMFCDSPKPK